MNYSIGLLFLLIPLAYYALYTMIIRAMSRGRSLPSISDGTFSPSVSIVIPTYNEMKVIGKRIENLDSLDYPRARLEVIFVDGASTDGTPEFVERCQAEGREYIRVVRQASRQGYNAAIYEGICNAMSNIVITAEAGSFFDPRAVSIVVRSLARPDIGVVTGKSVLYNPDESLATRLEAVYRNAHDAMRYAESVIDSTPDMKGELQAFRKEIGLGLRPRETLPDNAFFDMALSYKARSLGKRAIFDPDAIFYEYAPTNLRQRLIVQIRRGTGFTGALWNFRWMLFNRKFGLFGMLIAPSRLLMLIIFPWVFLVAPFLLLWESLSEPLLGISLLLVALVGLVPRRTRYSLISFCLSQIVLAAATLRLLFRKHPQFIGTVPTARR